MYSPEKKAPIARPLFRQQAVEFATTRQYGTVLLKNYVSHGILTALFFAICASIIAFLLCFGTTRKAEVSGALSLSKGVVRVRPGQTGIVKQVLVKEGQKVNAGDVMFTLSSERNIGIHESAESRVFKILRSRRDSYNDELLQANQQSTLRLLAIKKRSEALLEEQAHLDSQIMLQKSRTMLVLAALKRFKELHDTNYISSAQLEEKEGELLDQRQRLAELERLRGINVRDYSSARAEYDDLTYQAQRDEEMIRRNTLIVQQDLAESEARWSIDVVAPIAGTVTTIAVEAGKPVLADSTLTSVLPAGAELEAEIYAPSRSIGFVKPGMKVLLRYQSFPYQKFGQYEAIVREVAGTSMSTQELALSNPTMPANHTSEPLYRVRLRLRQQNVLAYGKRFELKPGMLLDGSIILEYRRLYEWVLEPLFSISGRSS